MLLVGTAATGHFDAGVVGALGWSALCAVLIHRRRDLLSGDWSPRRWHLAGGSGYVLVVGLYVSGFLSQGFATEAIVGGLDDGVYAGHAMFIAREGRLSVPNPLGMADEQPLRSLYRPPPGLFAGQPDLTVQFPPLFTVWLAQAHATFGVGGLFRMNGIVALLSMAVFHGVARSLMPALPAALATLCLVLNPAQIWVSRITLSETAAQLALWAGLLLLVASPTGRRRGSAWAGTLLGLGAVIRLELFVVCPSCC